MGAYYLLLILPILSVIYKIITGKSSDKIALKVFFFILFVMLALRSVDVGTDLRAYAPYFNRIWESPWLNILNPFGVQVSTIEWGYQVLNKILSSMYYNFHFFLAVVACITIFPIALLYIKESSLPLVTIVLFVNMPTFVLLFSGLRQAIAVAIGCIAFHFVQNKHPVKFICMVFLASLFHISAMILLIMYPVYYMQITTKYMPVIFTILGCTLFFIRDIFIALVPLFSTKYASRYMVIEETGAYNMLFLFILFTLFSFIIVNKKQETRKIVGFRNFLLINLFIQAFATINTVAMRLGYYYLIFIPLLIPMVMTHGNPQYRLIIHIAHIAILTFFFVYFFFNAYCGADVLNVYPYMFLWE